MHDKEAVPIKNPREEYSEAGSSRMAVKIVYSYGYGHRSSLRVTKDWPRTTKNCQRIRTIHFSRETKLGSAQLMHTKRSYIRYLGR